MKLSRWIASAALGCLMIAAAYLPPEPREERYLLPSPTSTEEARLKLVSDARQRTEDLLAGLRFRDSVRTRLRANVARPAEAALVVTGSVPADRQQSIRRTMEQIWREAHGVDGSSLLLLLDVQPKLRRYTVEYVLPQALDQRTCVVAITIDPTMKWLWSTSVLSASDLPSALRESLGPCLYYAAFGEPGPHIARWLEERSYKLANSGNWTKPAEVARRSEDPAAWNVLVSNMSFNAVACLAGRADRCRPVVADVQQEEPLFRGASRGRAARVTGVFKRVQWGGTFPNEDYFLASLVRETGRERFAQFWRSAAPVDSAFRAAFGQPLEQWTANWARRQVPPLPPFSPAPRPIAVLFAALAVGIAVALAAAGVMRRQVS